MPMNAKQREMAMKAIMVKKAREESRQLKGSKMKEAEDYASQKRREAANRKAAKQAMIDTGGNPGSKVNLYAAAVKKQNQITQRQTMKRINRHPNPNPGLKLAVTENKDRPLSARSDDSVEARYGKINRDKGHNPDEVWRLYNEMQKEEFDEKTNELKQLKREQQAVQKAAINRQKAEQKRIALEKKQVDDNFYQQQLDQKKKWQEEERMAKQRTQEKNQQFTRSFNTDIKRLEKQKKDEQQRKLALENRTMNRIRKEQDDEKAKNLKNKMDRMQQMAVIKIENNKLLKVKEDQRTEAVAYEQKLNADYRAKLEKQDRDREEGLKQTYARQEKLMDLGKFAQQSMADRLKADEDRAQRVQMERSALEERTAREKELARKRRAKEQTKALDVQVRLQAEVRKREIEDDQRIVANAIAQSRQIDEAEKRKQEKRKQDYQKQQQLVTDQIRIRRQKAQLGQLNQNTGLSATEKAMNKHIIDSLNQKYGDKVQSVLSKTGSSIAKS